VAPPPRPNSSRGRLWSRWWWLALVVIVGLTPVALSLFGPSPATDARRRSRPPYSDVGVALGYHPLIDPEPDVDHALATIADLGARWVRFDLNWSIVEAERGTYDWQRVDAFVEQARRRGLRLLATVAYTPRWARAGRGDDKQPPRDPRDYARFAAVAALRFPPDRIAAWELWNEPNNGNFWAPRPDAAAYARLATQAARAIHSEQPQATVVLGGLSPAGPLLDWQSDDGRQVSPWRFLRDVVDADVISHVDAVGFHPYAAQPLSPSDLSEANPFQQTLALRELLDAGGDRQVPIWGTEAGAWTGGDRGIPETAQTRYVREYLRGWHAFPETGPFFYYELSDEGDDPGVRGQHFGLVRSDGSHKPAYAAFHALSGRR
jgi:polysaccharide biosynthesis protein PslG